MKELQILWIGLAGGIGAVFRVYASAALESWTRIGVLGGHLGTLSVNLFGCLLVGAALHLVSDSWRLVVVGGLLGGLTTFGTLGALMLDHLERGAWLGLALHLVGHLFGGVLAVWVGRALARACWPMGV